MTMNKIIVFQALNKIKKTLLIINLGKKKLKFHRHKKIYLKRQYMIQMKKKTNKLIKKNNNNNITHIKQNFQVLIEIVLKYNLNHP